MNKPYWNNVLKNWFNLTENSRVIYYRNPNDCSTFQYEHTDGNTEGLVWGKRKDSTKNWIRICKVLFMNGIIFFVDGIRNTIVSLIAYINYVDMPLFICYIVFAFFMYQMIFYFSGVGVFPLSQN